MESISSFQFSLQEMFSFLGAMQALYVLFYMLTRSGSFSSAIIPSLLFSILSAAFVVDALEYRLALSSPYYEVIQWALWFSLLPAGLALLYQIVSVPEKPQLRYVIFLFVVPFSMIPLFWGASMDVIYNTGLVCGCLCLSSLWFKKETLGKLHGNALFGEERFWLVMASVMLQVAMLGSILAFTSGLMSIEQWELVRTVLGIAFAYVAATSLFRIYPQAVEVRKKADAVFSKKDHALLQRLDDLLTVDKIYQDAAFGRSELARELDTGEANLSRLVNLKYNKTIPQLLNERRVRDAQELLKNSGTSIQTVFEESGFNSLTTFNRVFKDLTGDTPTQYRARH